MYSIYPFDGREDGEHAGVGLVEISNQSAMLRDLFFRTEPFDRV